MQSYKLSLTFWQAITSFVPSIFESVVSFVFILSIRGWVKMQNRMIYKFNLITKSSEQCRYIK
jgi:hypothetical protein